VAAAVSSAAGLLAELVAAWAVVPDATAAGAAVDWVGACAAVEVTDVAD
jgi:hypothetical protein